jgi:tRNA nucleotidyltransferase (CCA-adding enzyme)
MTAPDDPIRRLTGRCYRVGGCVRDALLGLESKDRDWVVVGSSPHEMVAAGFQPVGKDFPVFLHPQTREEYALARTERKSAPGYHGFTFHASPEVTLEQDLARRDLTINAMALDDAGHLIDPFLGERDLREGVLRHVSPAFAEDPVRLLRTARFAARFEQFRVHPDTLRLMRQLVEDGEVDALVAERVWQELSRGLMEGHPGRMLEVLRSCGALKRLLPEVDRRWAPEVDAGLPLLKALDECARSQAPLPVRWACLMLDLGHDLAHEQRGAPLARQVADRLKVPSDCQALADVVTRERGHIHRSGDLGPEALLDLLERCDALRRPERFAQVLWACECDAIGHGGRYAGGHAGRPPQAYRPRTRLAQALSVVIATDTRTTVAQAQAQGWAGPRMGQAIRHARVAALSAWAG